MRTRIQSDRTWVPPVTADRSPPDSRMTGADSPVIAASLTEATPSTTSPSLGMMSPASTSTRSPTLSCVPGTSEQEVPEDPVSSLACVSVRVLRKDAAWALPRPSATPSAKFANSRVNQSHRMICDEKPGLPSPVMRSLTNRIVVRMATTSTTNITGLRTMWRGSSFRKAAPSAGTMILGSVMEARVAPSRGETAFIEKLQSNVGAADRPGKTGTAMSGYEARRMTNRKTLIRTVSEIVSAMTTAIGLQAAPGTDRRTGPDMVIPPRKRSDRRSATDVRRSGPGPGPERRSVRRRSG